MMRNVRRKAPAKPDNQDVSDRAPSQPVAEEKGAGPARKVVSFLRQHRAAVAAGGGAVAVIAILAVLFISGDGVPPPRRVQEITIVSITPPPPPPPPPEPQKMPEPEMIKQEEIIDPQIKEETPVEEPKDAPPEMPDDAPPAGPLGPGADLPEGAGPSQYGPGGPGRGNGDGPRWGRYSAMVTQQIEAALRANAKTRSVVMQIQVRLWADNSGRVSRVQLVSSTGNPEIDAVIRNEVLAGLTLREPPPADMPMPMVTRITARRPS